MAFGTVSCRRSSFASSTDFSRRQGDGFPLPNQWNIVHSIALNEEAQLLCAADRDNYRIQCFNSNTGEFQRQIRVEGKENIGPIYAIEFAPETNGSFLLVHRSIVRWTRFSVQERFFSR